VRVYGDPTQDRRDAFGRLLAYVKTKGGPQLNIAQVRRGWAKVFVFQGEPVPPGGELSACRSVGKEGQPRGLGTVRRGLSPARTLCGSRVAIRLDVGRSTSANVRAR